MGSQRKMLDKALASQEASNKVIYRITTIIGCTHTHISVE